MKIELMINPDSSRVREFDSRLGGRVEKRGTERNGDRGGRQGGRGG